MSNTCYNHLKDSSALGGCPVTWEIFKRPFLTYSPREQREAKVEYFIRFNQGGMSVKKYSLKVIKLSKYASSLVSNARDEISHLVTGVSENLKKNVVHQWFMKIWIFIG